MLVVGHRAIAIFIWLLSAAMVYALWRTARSGAKIRKDYRRDPFRVAEHRRWRRRTVVITVLVIVAADRTFWALHLPLTPFFWHYHLPLIIVYPLLLIASWTWNGVRHRQHYLLGRAAFFCGFLAAVTGDWLTYILIWRS